MTDRVKQRLDRQWNVFLDELNATYEEAYLRVAAMAKATGGTVRVDLLEVHWPVDQTIRVGLRAMMQEDGGSDDDI